MNLVKRKTIVIDIPLEQNIEILYPELTIIKFPHNKKLDIGSICYLLRESPTTITSGNHRNLRGGKKVQLDSLSEQRKKNIRKIIKLISDKLKYSGLKCETVISNTSRFLPFMFWADQNNFKDLMIDNKVSYLALKAYTEYLKERVRNQDIKNKSASIQQKNIINFLSEYWNDDNLFEKIPLIDRYNNFNNSTSPPCEKNQAKIIKLCEHIFDGLSSLVIDFKKYPYILTLPDYLKFKSNKIWVFPGEKWFIHPNDSTKPRNRCLGYNYESGTINNINEINNLRFFKEKNSNSNISIINNANKNINEANLNYRHNHRLRLASFATNIFIILFVAHTGMNWSQIVNLMWNDNYKILSDYQLFRTIKWRAGGKECYFELPINFMPRFKRFIALRKFILNDKKIDYLFFSVGNKGLKNPSKILTPSLFSIYTNTLKLIDLEIKFITTREWRAAKSDWLIKNTDVSTTALILQNTEKTVLASYATGSQTKHCEEISQFFKKISEIVIISEKNSDVLVNSALGQCSSYKNPFPLVEDQQIISDCVQSEGCLFCDKYRIHNDEKDIRKLISCRYCIIRTSYLLGSIEEQSKILNPILERIDLYLNELRKTNLELVERIILEVEEGELDTYWSKKIEMFMELEWLN